MDIRYVPQLLGDFIEVEARALRERDQDDLVKGRFAVAALAPARLAFGRDQAELLIVTQRRCRHGGALGHLADVDQLTGCHQMGVAVHGIFSTDRKRTTQSGTCARNGLPHNHTGSKIVSSTKERPRKSFLLLFLKLKLASI